MGHSDDPGDGRGAGARGCGGNMLVAGAAVNKGSFIRRNVRSAVNTVASLRAARAKMKKI